MTDEEVEAAARADPDAQPWPDERPMRKAAAVKRMRFALRLSQEDFAARYHLPLSLLKAWERHEAEPDVVAQALLTLIEADPEGAARALAKSAGAPAAAE
jgi:putative transcriptional regulator